MATSAALLAASAARGRVYNHMRFTPKLATRAIIAPDGFATIRDVGYRVGIGKIDLPDSKIFELLRELRTSAHNPRPVHSGALVNFRSSLYEHAFTIVWGWEER